MPVFVDRFVVRLNFEARQSSQETGTQQVHASGGAVHMLANSSASAHGPEVPRYSPAPPRLVPNAGRLPEA
ncbi:MAG: hypothetical protein ACRDSN_09095, partial [Pseudonocardiaceae bacterium]